MEEWGEPPLYNLLVLRHSFTCHIFNIKVYYYIIEQVINNLLSFITCSI